LLAGSNRRIFRQWSLVALPDFPSIASSLTMRAVHLGHVAAGSWFNEGLELDKMRILKN
jgi:hypothetical protein